MRRAWKFVRQAGAFVRQSMRVLDRRRQALFATDALDGHDGSAAFGRRVFVVSSPKGQ